MEREGAAIASAAVRRPPVALLATVLAVLLAPVAAQAQAPRTVPSELDALLAAGAIDQPHHDAWAESYDNAKATLKKLHGTRRRQLDAVIANTRAIAKAGLLTPTRAPLVFLTLQRNRAWWSEGSLLRYGQRVMFAGSQLVWQYYPGQGIQVQWLGTFGRANGLFQQTGRDDELRALLDEALGLATARAGGIAWESLFHFDGGAPPWVSGLSQGTALQALSRAAARLGEPRYFEAARAALGIFRAPPPEGVRVDTPVGAHYLQYSFAPEPAHHQRLHPGAQRALRLRGLRQRRRGARALRGRRGAGARRAADLRHGRVVAVPARPGERPRLPRAPARLPARAVQARPRSGALLHRGRPLHRRPAPAARARPEVDLRGGQEALKVAAGYGQRVRFAGSQLLWQYYPGQGIQVQWLGTFGRGDGLFDTAGRDADLRALLDEALGLATAARGRHRVGVALPLRRRARRRGSAA